MNQAAAHKPTMSKRKRFWKIVFIILLVTICLCAAAIAAGIYALGNSDRIINKDPIMSTIRMKSKAWNARINLIPEVFQEGDNLSSVQNILKASEFSPGYFQERVPMGQLPKKNDSEITWTREQGSFACNMEWAVFLKFSPQNTLVSAEGTVGERGCL